MITVDFSGVLDEKQLKEIEDETNRKIWENTEVEIFYPEKEELEKLALDISNVKNYIDGKEIVKIVTISKKLVSIVVK